MSSAESAAANDMTGAIATTTEHGTTASETAATKGRATAAETSAMNRGAAATEAAASTAAKSAATATAAAMPALHFVRQSVGDVLRGRRSARIDQRQRLGALAGCCREREYRGSRKAPAHHGAPGIWNCHHG
jgi:hypothetical protein